jgi:drug/metabolite transporter (DMT)-like permease
VSALGWILLSLVFLAWAPAYYYDQFSAEVTTGLDTLWALSFLAFPVVGVFLSRRISTNPVGWLFLIGPGLIGAGVSIVEYGEAVGIDLASLSAGVIAVGLVSMFASILLFPDGRYPNRWFRWAHLIGLVGFVVGLASAGEATSSLAVAFNFGLAILSLVFRWVQGDAVVRRQIAGLLLVGFLGVVLFAMAGVSDVLVPSDDERLGTMIGTSASMILSIGIPVSIAVAITRFRLYEMDRIISRTMAYVISIALLGAVYVVGLTTLTSFLPAESPLAVAGSTLAAVALFNPVRKGVQGWVDRRFNRSRYDARQVMDRFANSLQGSVDTDEIVDGWVGVVSETMQPRAVAVWVREESTPS